MSEPRIRHYPSPDAFWEAVSRPADWDVSRGGSTGTDTDWHGSRDYAEALELARHGWPEGVKRIKPLAAKVYAKLALSLDTPRPVYDVVGECPDVGAYLTGELEHMIRFEPGEGAGRVVRLVYNVTASRKIDPDVMTRRGAAICGVLDAIEQAGLRSEVVAAWSNKGWASAKSCGYLGFITVKVPEEPLNMDRIAFCLAHPSFFRRLVFRAWELEDKAFRETYRVTSGGGYGKVAEIPEGPMRGDIYLEAMSAADSRWSSGAAAEVAALDMLKAAGVELAV